MDQLRDSIAKGDLVQDVRRLLQSGAQHRARWLRENLRHALAIRKEDAVAVSALTGLAPGTVRGFLKGRPSSVDNVLLIAEATGYSLAELDRSPEEFERYVELRHDSVEGAAIGVSLLAFDESPTPMAIVLLDGTIVKVNRKLRELLGYDEGELVGASGASFSTTTDSQRAAREEEIAATDAMRGQRSELRRKDGELVSVLASALVVRDSAGAPRYVIARAIPTEAAPATR